MVYEDLMINKLLIRKDSAQLPALGHVKLLSNEQVHKTIEHIIRNPKIFVPWCNSKEDKYQLIFIFCYQLTIYKIYQSFNQINKPKNLYNLRI